MNRWLHHVSLPMIRAISASKKAFTFFNWSMLAAITSMAASLWGRFGFRSVMLLLCREINSWLTRYSFAINEVCRSFNVSKLSSFGSYSNSFFSLVTDSMLYSFWLMLLLYIFLYTIYIDLSSPNYSIMVKIYTLLSFCFYHFH